MQENGRRLTTRACLRVEKGIVARIGKIVLLRLGISDGEP